MEVRVDPLQEIQRRRPEEEEGEGSSECVRAKREGGLGTNKLPNFTQTGWFSVHSKKILCYFRTQGGVLGDMQ